MNKQAIDIVDPPPSLFAKQSLKSQSSQASGSIGTDGLFKCLDTECAPPTDRITHKQEVGQRNVLKNETTRTRLFRYLICTMGLFSITQALMSRVILNIAIVEIAIRQPVMDVEFAVEQLKEQLPANDEGDSLTTSYIIEESTTEANPFNVNQTTTTTDSIDPNWSMKDKNFVLSSFYLGYAPTMFFGGTLADTYGSKMLILVSVIGGALMNIMTPYMANHSYGLLVASRIFLGVVYGSLLPACFDLFNRWLTNSEKSIFVPMLKVSIALGGVISGLICVIVLKLGYMWPMTFYSTGVLGLLFAIAWVILATNEPEENRFLVEQPKKNQPIELSPKGYRDGKMNNDERKTKEKAPMFLIMTNKSVLVLGLVKLSMGFGVDFVFSMLSIYLRDAHSASSETIGFVVSQGPFVQMFLTIPVAWLAKHAVENELFGFSRTIWRKIFQGFSNFAMALSFFLITVFYDNLNMVIFLIIMINIVSMFSAGGEAMIPYDLSIKYPATILGFTHSFSLIAGILVPSLATLVVGNAKENKPEQWNGVFLFLSGFLVVGGLLFVMVLKAEPFLPGERDESKKQSK